MIDTDSHVYLVMENASGGELFDYIVNRGKLNEKEGRKLFRQIVSACVTINGQEIVHRGACPHRHELPLARKSSV